MTKESDTDRPYCKSCMHRKVEAVYFNGSSSAFAAFPICDLNMDHTKKCPEFSHNNKRVQKIKTLIATIRKCVFRKGYYGK